MTFSFDDQQSGMPLCVIGGGDGCAPLEVHDVIPENEDAELGLLRRSALQEERGQEAPNNKTGNKANNNRERERKRNRRQTLELRWRLENWLLEFSGEMGGDGNHSC